VCGSINIVDYGTNWNIRFMCNFFCVFSGGGGGEGFFWITCFILCLSMIVLLCRGGFFCINFLYLSVGSLGSVGK
jgi:hypothetical protein